MKSIKHIIWDWNGTLLDDLTISLAAMNGILKKYDMPPLSRERYLRIIDFPIIIYYERLGFDFTKTPFEMLSDQFVAAYNATWRTAQLHQGAVHMLDTLRNMGLHQSILSASKQDWLTDQVAYFGLSEYFSLLSGRDDHHALGKAHLGKAHTHQLGVQPDEVLMIGDTVHDGLVADEIGCDCVLLKIGHQHDNVLDDSGYKTLESIDEVHTFITTYNNQKEF